MDELQRGMGIEKIYEKGEGFEERRRIMRRRKDYWSRSEGVRRIKRRS